MGLFKKDHLGQAEEFDVGGKEPLEVSNDSTNRGRSVYGPLRQIQVMKKIG